jgi:hypothetical protein
LGSSTSVRVYIGVGNRCCLLICIHLYNVFVPAGCQVLVEQCVLGVNIHILHTGNSP